MILTAIVNYNAGEALAETLNSIYRNMEKADNVLVSVVDNDSIDMSKVLLLNNKDLLEKIVFNPINVGKARAANELIRDLVFSPYIRIHDEDLIFSLDSDLRLESPDFFNTIKKVWKDIGTSVSCLVCAQVGNSLMKRDLKFNKTSSGYTYFIPEEGYGHNVAAGAVIVPYKYWQKVGGYSERGLYGGDDGPLLRNLFKVTKKPICVVKDLTVFHPYDTNLEYKQWKEKCFNQQRKFGKCVETRGFFDKRR